MAELRVLRPGILGYEEGRAMQKRVAAARQADRVPDTLILLEHYPVYTKGRRSEPAHLPMGEDWYRMQGIEVLGTDRGGQVTYHGPGQLVGYPIVDINAPRLLRSASGPGAAEEPSKGDVVQYVRDLERVVCRTLADYGIGAGCIDGLTGVWVGERKIGQIGLHVSRGVTTHGLAINVNNDLQPFEWIVPCGIEACQVTSVCRELGTEQNLSKLASALAGHYGEVFGRRPVEADAAEFAAAPA